jgi:hypothetical protein
MSPTVSKVANILSAIIVIILTLIPFHAFLTVWLSSLLGQYTLLRLWKEVLLAVLLAGAFFILIKNAGLRKQLANSLVSRLIIIYIIINLIWGFASFAMDKVTLKALSYGLIVNLRFLVFFLVVWVVASLSPKLLNLWPKILLIPAVIVIVVGLLQRLVLPYDFLKHFGYGQSKIFPYETINHNVNYPRVMSTLRGANPLGAYLILILTALTALFIKDKKRRLIWGGFATLGFFALLFSYSRSAWIGLIISLLILGWMSLKIHQLQRIILPFVAILLALIVFGLTSLRHNPTYENIFFHTQTGSSIKTSSNDGHLSAFKDGIHDLLNEPLGRGVGTAGPASVYNNNNVRISENYFLQIAQETGWAGLIIFITIIYLVACGLWYRRSEILARVLLASLAGITFVNLLSHAWADDTLAYLWWGLTGLALTPILAERQKAHGKRLKTKS